VPVGRAGGALNLRLGFERRASFRLLRREPLGCPLEPIGAYARPTESKEMSERSIGHFWAVIILHRRPLIGIRLVTAVAVDFASVLVDEVKVLLAFVNMQ